MLIDVNCTDVAGLKMNVQIAFYFAEVHSCGNGSEDQSPSDLLVRKKSSMNLKRETDCMSWRSKGVFSPTRSRLRSPLAEKRPEKYSGTRRVFSNVNITVHSDAVVN